MPFIVPFIPLIAAGIGSAVGGVAAAKQQGTQQKALSEQEQLAQQEMQSKQEVFKQLMPFFQQYMQSGNPYLAQSQTASAQQTAQGANAAAGQLRNQMQTSGLGYGPSGATAAGLAQIGTGAGQTGAANYLQNLLNSEQLKFQAASGMNQLGQMMGSQQNQPNVSTQLQPANLGSSIFGAGQAIGSTIPQGTNTGGTPSGSNTGTLPLPTNVPNNSSLIFGMPGAAPSTQGGSSFGWS